MPVAYVTRPTRVQYVEDLVSDLCADVGRNPMWFWQEAVYPDMLDTVSSIARRARAVVAPDADALEHMASTLPGIRGRAVFVYIPADHDDEKICTVFELLERVSSSAIVVCFAHVPPPTGVRHDRSWDILQIPDLPGPA